MFRNILNTFGTKGITAVINLAIAIILSQVLGASGKGEQGLIVTTIAFMLVFANLIGGATLVYFTPRLSHSALILPSYLWSVLTAFISYILLQTFPIIDTAADYSRLCHFPAFVADINTQFTIIGEGENHYQQYGKYFNSHIDCHWYHCSVFWI